MIPDYPLWRQTPPAIFPVCLGFMALALGWRRAADVVPSISQDIGNLLLGLSTGFFIWFLAFYVAKLGRRPAVLLEDMRSAPARAGMAAMAMAMMLLAAALLPLNLSVPQVWWTGVLMQVAASAIVLFAIWKDPPQKRRFTTFQYLTFVGPVVGPIAGVPLGYVTESVALIFAALVAYVIVTVGIVVTFRKEGVAHILRPSVMIFLAPVCLFSLGFGVLGYIGLFTLFYWLSWAILLALIPFVPWMMKGGYTPAWAAFTFPIAAFLNVQVMALSMDANTLSLLGMYGAMVVATPVILWISYRSIIAWVTGELMRKSGAAIA